MSSPALVWHTFSFPAPLDSQMCTRSPPPPWSWSVEARRGAGSWGLGPSHHRPGRHLGAADKQNTSSSSGRAPGCTREGACVPLAQGSAPSARGQGTGQLRCELEVKQGEEFHTIGQGTRLGTGGVMRSLCVERVVRGRKCMGRAPWGTSLTSGASWLALPVGWDLRCEREGARVPEALPCRDRAL